MVVVRREASRLAGGRAGSRLSHAVVGQSFVGAGEPLVVRSRHGQGAAVMSGAGRNRVRSSQSGPRGSTPRASTSRSVRVSQSFSLAYCPNVKFCYQRLSCLFPRNKCAPKGEGRPHSPERSRLASPVGPGAGPRGSTRPDLAPFDHRGPIRASSRTGLRRSDSGAHFLEAESERALDSLVWSHFPPRTGTHFAGKCSSEAFR
jgi:hypothetical protein